MRVALELAMLMLLAPASTTNFGAEAVEVHVLAQLLFFDVNVPVFMFTSMVRCAHFHWMLLPWSAPPVQNANLPLRLFTL